MTLLQTYYELINIFYAGVALVIIDHFYRTADEFKNFGNRVFRRDGMGMDTQKEEAEEEKTDEQKWFEEVQKETDQEKPFQKSKDDLQKYGGQIEWSNEDF